MDNDIIYLRLDRSKLAPKPPGQFYRGVVKFESTAGAEIDFPVRAEIPPLRGEWEGFATVTTVNGKRNKVPDIDLFISFFADTTTTAMLRGAIDSRNSLLWPVDVPLIGYLSSSTGSAFSMTGSFVLPPGDQNNEPFDDRSSTGVRRLNDEVSPPPADPDAADDLEGPGAEDVDWNNNGLVDAINPYPFPIQRTVTLSGVLVKGSPFDGYAVEGSYTELVTGMMKGAIQLEGKFSLTRRSDLPSRSALAGLLNDTPDTGNEPALKRSSMPHLFLPRRASCLRLLSRFRTCKVISP